MDAQPDVAKYGGVHLRLVAGTERYNAELEALEPTLRAKVLHIAELLQTFGHPRVWEPYVKPLGIKP